MLVAVALAAALGVAVAIAAGGRFGGGSASAEPSRGDTGDGPAPGTPTSIDASVDEPPPPSYFPREDDGEGDDGAGPATKTETRAGDPGAPLPRTSPVPYGELRTDERYLVYSPSGGWSNQMWELATALILARQANRTLVVPMAAKHTNGWGRYALLGEDSLVPMDRVLDLEHMERAFASEAPRRRRLVPLDRPLEPWWEDARRRLPKHFTQTINIESAGESKEDARKALLKSKAGAVFLHGHGFYDLWFSVPQMVDVRRFVRPAPASRSASPVSTSPSEGSNPTAIPERRATIPSGRS